MYRTALVLAALFGAAGVFADTVYKSVRPDGRIVYGDEPVKGAVRVERLEFPRAPDNASSSAGASAPAAGSPFDDAAGQRLRALDRVDAEIKAAAAALEEAQKRLEQGQEPLPGERTGNAGGGSRLNENYSYRIGILQDQVDAANKRLQAAYARRNALRD
jgi:hypothetical protein